MKRSAWTPSLPWPTTTGALPTITWVKSSGPSKIIVAIWMQREDLKIQQKELTESRKAQEAQVNALTIATLV